MIELEQEVVTGVNNAGDDVKNKDILGKFAKMITKITEDEKVRLMLTLHTCLDISEKDFNIISDKIDNDKKRGIYNLEWLGK